MQNTNTKMQNTNTKQLRVPNHKADRQNTNRNIAKDSEGCPVSLSVSQVNFINVMTGVSQFVMSNKVTYSVVLVDCPITQVICIGIFICVT